MSSASAPRLIAVSISSPNRVGFAQALEQRRAQQILARQYRIVSGPAQFIVVALPYRRILLGQKFFVAHGLRLRVRDGDMAALALVAIEHAIVGFAAGDGDELVGEIDC